MLGQKTIQCFVTRVNFSFSQSAAYVSTFLRLARSDWSIAKMLKLAKTDILPCCVMSLPEPRNAGAFFFLFSS